MSGRRDDALEEAAQWFFRQDGQLLPEAERARFEAWLAVPANRAAYEEIAGAWHEAGALAGPRTLARRPPAWRGVARIAAALLVICGALGYGLDVPTRLRADIYTATGERRAMTLPDGSTVDVNTSSALAVAFTPGERRVKLLRGEAVFTVAKDAARPFVVEADGDAATALGTVFAVRETGAGAIVTVIESRVSVAFAAGGDPARLGPGQQVRPLGDGHEVAAVDADAAIAWRRGKLIFADRPLGGVIDELNRYHSGLIRILDPSLNGLRVSGVFDTADPVGIVDALEDSLGISSTRLGSAVVLLHR